MQRTGQCKRPAKRRRNLTSVVAFLLALVLPATALAEVELNIGDGSILVDDTNAYQESTVEMPNDLIPTESGAGDWVEKTDGFDVIYYEASDNGDWLAREDAEMITLDVYKDKGAHEGTVVISGTSQAVFTGDDLVESNTVSVDAGQGNAVEIVLSDLTIDALAASEENACPIDIQSGDVTVELDGENTLISGIWSAAIETSYADGEGSLTITDTDQNGTLHAEGSLTATGHEVDINGNPIEYDPETYEPLTEPYDWELDKCYASAAIGGGAHWIDEWNPDTGEYDSYDVVEAGKNITIEGGTITAIGGVEVYEEFDPETNESTLVKNQYLAPAIGGAVLWEVGKAKVVAESDVTITGGNVTRVDGAPEYDGFGAPSPEEPVDEPTEPAEQAEQATEVILGDHANAKISVTNGTVTEEVTDTGAKTVVVNFDKAAGAVSFGADNLSAILEAGYSVLEVKLGDALVKIDLGLLKARIGEDYRNISLRLVNGKLVLTAIDPNGVLVDLSDLLNTDA